MQSTLLRSASAADLPPGYRWLGPDESTAAQDMLWDMALVKWVPITRAFIGLHVRHFTSVIRRTGATPAPAPSSTAPAPPEHPTINPAQATARGFVPLTCRFDDTETHLLNEVTNGLKARRVEFIIVTIAAARGRKPSHEVWTPKKKKARY